MRAHRLSLLVFPFVLAIGCGESDEDDGGSGARGGSSNAGSSNAGSSNAGSSNAGSSNAGSSNAGSSNAGSSNAGSSNTGGASGEAGASGAAGEGDEAGGTAGEGGTPSGAGGSSQGGEPGTDGGSAGMTTGSGGAGGGDGGANTGEGGAGPNPNTPRPVAEAVVGDLIITEIMRNPGVVDDTVGEWFELHNTTDRAFELAGLTLADGTGSADVTGSAVIAAGGYVVLARSGGAGNGGVTPAFVYGDELQLGQGSDLVRISVGGTVLDVVSWDASFPQAAGASMSLKGTATNTVQNDTAANWCAAGARFGAGDLGTPGVANGGCLLTSTSLAAGDLVITEIMANPNAVEDIPGEWFELHNPTTNAYDLSGVSVSDEGVDAFTIDQSVIVAAGEYVVLGSNADAGTNGGIAVDYAYLRADFALANATDEIIVETAIVIDAVAYDTAFPNVAGQSISLSPGASSAGQNDQSANWCSGTNVLPSTDRATPGARNTTCP